MGEYMCNVCRHGMCAGDGGRQGMFFKTSDWRHQSACGFLTLLFHIVCDLLMGFFPLFLSWEKKDYISEYSLPKKKMKQFYTAKRK